MNVKILEDIKAERDRQDEKWGSDQHHPDLDKEVKLGPGQWNEEDACIFAGLMSERAYKAYNDRCVQDKTVNWAGILAEEIAEAVASAANPLNKAHTREELVQAAAVCVAWIEDLDSRA